MNINVGGSSWLHIGSLLLPTACGTRLPPIGKSQWVSGQMVLQCSLNAPSISAATNPMLTITSECSLSTDPEFLPLQGEHNRAKKEGTEQVRRVTRMLIHPQYNHTSTDRDLSLLYLKREVVLGPFVVPVCLPALDGSFWRTLGAMRTSVVSGWGRLAQSGPPSTLLQRLEVPRVPLQECRTTGLNVTRNMLCAGFRDGKKDACQGDSGGPLVTRYKNTWFLTGVVSWGKGCAQEDVYGIYTRVSNFLDWINQTMATG